MGIFDRIKSAIWGESDTAKPKATVNPTSTPSVASTAGSPPPSSSPSAGAAPSVTTAQSGSSPSASSTPQTSAPRPSPVAATAPVDVAAILDAAVKKNGQKLDWRKSIVDLMKALDLDSSLSARKELAQELQYSGDTNDSAAMNVWLHKALMKKLAENGGKVPADLTD